MGILDSLFKKKNRKLITEEEMNTEIYDIVDSVIDYDKSIDELYEYCIEELKNIDASKPKYTFTEVVMLSQAIDFIKNIENMPDTKLTLDIKSLKAFDKKVDYIQKCYKFSKYSEEEYLKLFGQAVAYFGVIILKEHKGRWANSELGYAININNINAFVNNRLIYKTDFKESLVSYYKELVELLNSKN